MHACMCQPVNHISVWFSEAMGTIQVSILLRLVVLWVNVILATQTEGMYSIR